MSVTFFQLTKDVRLYLAEGVQLPIPDFEQLVETALRITQDANPPLEWMELGMENGQATLTGHVNKKVWRKWQKKENKRIMAEDRANKQKATLEVIEEEKKSFEPIESHSS